MNTQTTGSTPVVGTIFVDHFCISVLGIDPILCIFHKMDPLFRFLAENLRFWPCFPLRIRADDGTFCL